MAQISKETAQKIYDIHMKCLCEDTPELRELIDRYNKDVSPEAMALHKDCIVISMADGWFDRWTPNIDASGLTASGMTTPDLKATPGPALRYFEDAVSNINRNKDRVMLIRTPDDILKAKRENKLGIIFLAQSCEFLFHNDLDAAVSVFHDIGLRSCQLAYNHRTFAADGCATGTNDGLTKDGKRLIRAMQKYGVTVDLAHVGERSALDALDYAEKPMIFSHTVPAGLVKTGRNITDEMAKKCAATGGVMGVDCYPDHYDNGKDFVTIEDFINAIDYYVNLVGVDHVGLGLDSPITLGGYERRKLLNLFKGISEAGTDSYLYRSYKANRGFLQETMEGLVNLGNCPNITEHLMRRGYKEADIRKILGENWLRIFRETWVY